MFPAIVQTFRRRANENGAVARAVSSRIASQAYQLKPAPADTLLSPEENAPVRETLAFGATIRW